LSQACACNAGYSLPGADEQPWNFETRMWSRHTIAATYNGITVMHNVVQQGLVNVSACTADTSDVVRVMTPPLPFTLLLHTTQYKLCMA
jgi:hypothetical protein